MSTTAPMPWYRRTTPAALMLAWIMLAIWQWQEYKAECTLARDALRRQAESITNALIGGIQSHRRFGRYMEDQLQGALDELATSQDILAVGVVAADRRIELSAGQADLLHLAKTPEPGVSWDHRGFRQVSAFQLVSAPPMGPGMGGGHGPGWGRGGGGGGGGGGHPMPLPDRSVLDEGGRFFVVLILDRAQVDERIGHYAWLRIFVTVAGGLVIISVGLAWQSTVRLAEARGRAKLLEIETRNLRDLGQAAAGLAHETRNPLGLIRGWMQRWMQTLDDQPAQRQQAAAVIEECDRVTARINQFLAFARPCEPKMTEVDPAEVIRELKALLEPDLDAKRLQLKAETPKVAPSIAADREMFRQILFNLLQNAVDFSPPGGTIEIAVRRGENDATRIEIADRGPGIATEAQELLFTPYHTTRSSGTGLGLAIVRRIALAHGWQVGYTPRPGGGSIFWVQLSTSRRDQEIEDKAT